MIKPCNNLKAKYHTEILLPKFYCLLERKGATPPFPFVWKTHFIDDLDVIGDCWHFQAPVKYSNISLVYSILFIACNCVIA